ncbi:unnamed protein product [Choristocarpus tenellus]
MMMLSRISGMTPHIPTRLGYSLMDSDGNYYTEKGAYVIVDGGYHKAQARVERTSGECTQGCRECFFWHSHGPLQNRQATTTILAQEEDRYDIFFTCCCILQNMLHPYDDFGELEGNTYWTGDAGLHGAFYSDP